MKGSVPSIGLGILSFSAKLFVSLVAVAGLLMALHLVVKAHKLLLGAEQGLTSRPPVYTGNHAASTVAGSPVTPLWPEFSHSGSGNFQTTTINGIQVMTEQWNCGNSPDEILSYYHDQMTARGWQDTTEQAYSVQPELRPNSLDDPKFIDNYLRAKDSNLMLTRADWTLHISTEPARTGFRQTTVKFYAAQTPSILNLAQDTVSAVVNNQSQPQQPLDVIQKGANEDYHTTVTTKDEPPKLAFQNALEEEARKGWKPELFLPGKQQPSGYFAWLAKGQQYSALSVMSTRPGYSSVTFVEVTPH